MTNNSLLKNNPPTLTDGSLFFGYRVPGSQTFTSYSPSSDMSAYLQDITGLSGWKQRRLLQSPNGTEILSQGVSGKSKNNISYLGSSTYGSKASCQGDADCGTGQVCYTFNNQTIGPQQGPTCSPTVFPEIMLGNQFNNGKPLRQYSNFCYTDSDCKKTDKYTGKPKHGMKCNHYYKGDQFEQNGLCQVEYESGGKRYFLNQPPGWTIPLNEPLKSCKKQTDCGSSGINGWSRCASGALDGKNYCTWPGRTNIPSPSQLKNEIPQGFTESSLSGSLI